MDLAAQPPWDSFCSVLVAFTETLSLSYVCAAFAVCGCCGHKYGKHSTIQFCLHTK